MRTVSLQECDHTGLSFWNIIFLMMNVMIFGKKNPRKLPIIFFSNLFILSILLFFLFPLLSKREIVWKRGQIFFMILLHKMFFIKLFLIEMFLLRFIICSVITDRTVGTLFICVQLPRFQKIRENPQEDSNLS